MYFVILAVHSAEGPAPLWQNTGICQFSLCTEKERSATKWQKWWFNQTSHRKEDQHIIQGDMYRSELEDIRVSNLGIEYKKGWYF